MFNYHTMSAEIFLQNGCKCLSQLLIVELFIKMELHILSNERTFRQL